MNEHSDSEPDPASGGTTTSAEADGTPPESGPPCADLPLTLRAEAILLTSERPLSDQRLAELLGISGKGAATRLRQALDELNAHYERHARSFRAEHVAGGWQLLTRPEFAPLLERLYLQKQDFRLSQPALETLSIIAYRQPIMRAEIEAIRGVAVGEVVRSLLERRLVRVTGRAEQLGRPLLYGTTPQFLKVFGLGSTDDLPAVDAPPPERPPSLAEQEADAVEEPPVEDGESKEDP